MNEQHLSAVIAEDEDLVRSGLIRKIERSNLGIHIVGEATHGQEAWQMVQELHPQLLITDIGMPVMNGLQLIEEVHKYYPRISVIIASCHAEFEYARQAMRYDVKHYLLKPLKQQDLIETLAQVRAEWLQQPIVESRDAQTIAAHVQQYCREHFHENINLEQLAKQFNFSSAYLSKIFTKYAGEAPSKYITALRMNESKHLLKYRKDLSIKEVGEKVGYSDPFYFSRMFKQATGQTPRDYQNDH